MARALGVNHEGFDVVELAFNKIDWQRALVRFPLIIVRIGRVQHLGNQLCSPRLCAAAQEKLPLLLARDPESVCPGLRSANPSANPLPIIRAKTFWRFK